VQQVAKGFKNSASGLSEKKKKTLTPYENQ
jgi:hypothetical protein